MIQPSEFLRQAQSLIQTTPFDEVSLRSAVSRAYYSLYHESLRSLTARKRKFLVNEIERAIRWQGSTPDLAKLQALDWDYIVKENGVNLHAVISRVLRRTPGKYQLGSDFIDFRLKRDFADYDIDKNPATDFTQQIVGDILTLIQKVRQV